MYLRQINNFIRSLSGLGRLGSHDQQLIRGYLQKGYHGRQDEEIIETLGPMICFLKRIIYCICHMLVTRWFVTEDGSRHPSCSFDWRSRCHGAGEGHQHTSPIQGTTVLPSKLSVTERGKWMKKWGTKSKYDDDIWDPTVIFRKSGVVAGHGWRLRLDLISKVDEVDNTEDIEGFTLRRIVSNTT